MKDYSVFDVIGPIMIGPSSSHTAGAARLAKVACSIAGDNNIEEVKFYLHGSFAKTYKGHGTDKALIAGMLNMDPWDENLRKSFEIAQKNGLKYEFIEIDLGDAHPNTVKFVIKKTDGAVSEIIGSSIGGGNIVITSIDGQSMEFTGSNPTIVTHHKDVPGIISQISTIMYSEGINIGAMKVFREGKGTTATMTFETDGEIPKKIIDEIKAIKDIENVKIINPIK
ncbi:L-serine ammonia-lyase, iron-sulfur-dependent subunit beta [Clostridium botulinum]|uniref:L-serine ammonia-lyase, iron-sulfur-dependent subunit beta n=1 Tax=Clostridium botulinum TaxID=1491 RepID=UPI002492944C|nr:L-serine ammonia-lyase, iron-sulfur-dependent subunit beta [Clostridium botulinum]BDB01134.1 L-serine dehydratase, iron-sulfur-dependent subunit beta [Clostridium botulinum]